MTGAVLVAKILADCAGVDTELACKVGRGDRVGHAARVLAEERVVPSIRSNMLTADLVRLYPRLFHMTADGAWPSIEKHGLWSSQALSRMWGEVGVEARVNPRPQSVVLRHSELGSVTLRDQKPLHKPSLEAALTDMTVNEWLQALDSHVFFFLQRERLIGLLGARSYRNDINTILTIDTARFVQSYEFNIQLCAINSGFARPHSKGARGSGTFRTIEDYDHPNRESPRIRPRWDVAELCVPDGIPDVADYVISVERMQGDAVVEVVR